MLWQTVADIIKHLVNVLRGAKTPVWWEGSFEGSAAQPVNTGKMCSHPGTKLAVSTLIRAAALCCERPCDSLMNEQFACLNVCFLHLFS